MKQNELIKLLKPIVKECVKETLKESIRETMLESGLLASVITEVIKGVGSSIIVENKTIEPRKQKLQTESLQEDDQELTRLGKVSRISETEKNKLAETKKKLLNSIGQKLS